MEYIDGKSLHDLIKPRRRRCSVKQVITVTVEIAKIVEKIHDAGWVWNDCKPANLIVIKNKKLRPIDFENAHPATRAELFDWKTRGFSKSGKNSPGLEGKANDIFALGAVVYFLLTGRIYEADAPVKITKLRRNIPEALVEITENLLFDSRREISEIRKEFEKILDLL